MRGALIDVWGVESQRENHFSEFGSFWMGTLVSGYPDRRIVQIRALFASTRVLTVDSRRKIQLCGGRGAFVGAFAAVL